MAPSAPHSSPMNSIGRLRREQIDARKRPDDLRRREDVQPFAEGAIADLVVVLNEGDESAGRQPRAWTPARRIAVRHHLALVGEAFGERSSQKIRPAIGGVIAAAFTRGRDMENVMNVVIPLRGVELGLAAAARQAARVVALVLEQQVDGPVKARSKRLSRVRR